ncbi:MAG: ATP-binding cassette domain-containing protein [Planctomycetota bacterium]
MTSGAILLTARDLTVGRRRPLLGGIHWELRSGESWFVLGANGAGKSTLLQTLLGLLPPLRGRVEFGAVLRGRAALGFVPQEDRSNTVLPITVREFVALGLADDATSRAARRARVWAALQALTVSAIGDRPLSQLSLGQRRRALVARALARRPRLLVLDEPTANLDSETAEQLVRDLDRLRLDEDVCTVHAWHDRRLARRFGTHEARIRDGRLELQALAPACSERR